MKDLTHQLAILDSELASEIINSSTVEEIPKGTEILKEEQYVKVLPIVLSGVVKVFIRFEERELLLYYIRPTQSCVMSFSACLKNQPSKVFAVTEEQSKVLLVPVEKIPVWLKKYPGFNNLFHEQFDLRYTELLDTIQQILINKMDRRLYDYLLKKAEVLDQDEIIISHNQIANELGTVREVISRVMKKLEVEGKVSQMTKGIKILRQ